MRQTFNLNLPSASPLGELSQGMISERSNRGDWRRRIN